MAARGTGAIDAIEVKCRGKSGKTQEIEIDDKRQVMLVRACQALPGRHLFLYRDEDDMGAGPAALPQARAQGRTQVPASRTWP